MRIHSFPLPVRRTGRRLTGVSSIVCLYAVLAVVSTWPLARAPGTTVLLGESGCETVPLFNAWTVWWNADRLLHGFSGYWDAPIFHPAEDAFALSEPQPMTVLVAPVLWVTGSPVLAANIYFLISLTLNGVLGFLVLRRLQVQRRIALAGGAAVLLLPIVHWQKDVLQLVPLWPTLWTLAALLRLSRQPRVRTGMEAGIAYVCVFLSCGHYGLFLAILLAGTGWLLLIGRHSRRLWMASAAAVTVATVGMAPVAWKHHQVASARQFQRSFRSVERLSLLPGDYTAAQGRQLFDTGRLAARSQWRVSPGMLKYALACVGIVLTLRRRRLRQTTGFLVAFGGLSFALSLGNHVRIHEWHLWSTVAATIPGAAQVRNVFRFACFFQLAVVLLSTVGVSSLYTRLRQWRFRNPDRSPWPAAVLLSAVGTAALLEVLPSPPTVYRVPDPAVHADWIRRIRQESLPGTAVACIPFASGNRVTDFRTTVWWMLLSTRHRARLVNGYSGFFPREYFDLRAAVKRRFPAESVLNRLVHSGVTFVVVDTRRVDDTRLLEKIAASRSLKAVLRGASGVHVYRIVHEPAGSDRRHSHP